MLSIHPLLSEPLAELEKFALDYEPEILGSEEMNTKWAFIAEILIGVGIAT